MYPLPPYIVISSSNLVTANSYCWPGEQVPLTCQHGLLWEGCNAGGYSCYLPQTPQEVRGTYFLGRWKTPLGGDEWGQNVACCCSAGWFPSVRDKTYCSTIFLGWGGIDHFPILGGHDQSLLETRPASFCPLSTDINFIFFFCDKMRMVGWNRNEQLMQAELFSS